MKVEKKFNILNGFDFNLLDDEDFREDSVREEIVLPILKGLGYSHSKPNKIIRSKRLLHPFVSIGSARKKIHLIPDYLMEVEDRYAWLLDAKAPKQEILQTKHVEQAYSYAVNSEIRVPYFSLCNGREFVLFHISEDTPVVHFDLRLISSYWENLLKLLGPMDVLNYDFSYKKDFGLHLKRLGFNEFKSLIFPDVPIVFVARIAENLYTLGSGLKDGQESYVATFDFNSKVMEDLKGKIPDKAYDILTSPYRNAIENVSFVDEVYRINIDCQVGDKLEENEKEIFLPFWVNRILN
jgi:hypothetical protein